MKSIETVDINALSIDLDTTKAGKVAENFKAVTDLNLTASGAITVVGGKNIVAKTTGAATAITINEDGDATTAATIEKITIDSAGTGGATIGAAAANTSVDALKELTVKNAAAASTVAVTTAVETLKVNLDNNKSTNILNLIDAKLKTLNVDASGKDSIVNFDTSSTILETINISGNAKLNLTAGSTVITNSNVKEINVTNTKGVTIANTLGNDVKFTGGTGADSVVLGATTKAITMGAGDDTVKYGGALLTGGSVDAGADRDTIKMTGDQAGAFNGLSDNKFNTTFSNFEVLEIDTAPASAITIDTRKINNVSQVNVAAGLTTNSTIKNLVDGGTVKFTVTQLAANLTVNIFEPHTSTTNVLNLEVSADAAAAGTVISAGTVVAAGVETININSDDTNANPLGGFAHTLTLTADEATSIVVKGDAGITITPNGSVKVTDFDASAVTAGKVTFTSANTAVGEIVTIKGGAGADALEGSVTANDIIIGGAGNDTLVYTGVASGAKFIGGGADTFTGGAGDDTFDVNALGTKALHLTITDLSKGDKIDLGGITVTKTAAGGTTLSDKIAIGAGATFDQALNEAAKAAGGAGTLLKWFQFESNTYLVVDNDDTAATGATFVENTDSVIKITGLVDLKGSAVSATTDIITIG